MVTDDSIINHALSVAKQSFRDVLNKDIHIVDISYNALKVSDPDLDTTSYAALLKGIRTAGVMIYDDLAKVVDNFRTGKYNSLVYVVDPRYGTYLVARNYRDLQTTLSPILKDIARITEFTGTDASGTTVTNVGHIPSQEVFAAKSPLGEKIKAIAKATGDDPEILYELLQLYTVHKIDVSYSFTRPNFDVKGFNKILGEGTVLVTLHSSGTNKDFSTYETTISSEIRTYLNSEEFRDYVVNKRGSNTIKEDIALAMRVALGSKEATTSYHAPKKPTTKSITAEKTGKLTSSTIAVSYTHLTLPTKRIV